MQLTKKKFDEIIETLRSDASLAGERRRQPRVGFSAEVRVTRIASASSGSLLGRVRDISADGIGLLLSRRLRKGEEFLVHLEPEEGDEREVALLCMVRRCENCTGDRYVVGATYTPIDRANPGAAEPAHRDNPSAPKRGAEAEEVQRIRASILG